MRNMRIFGCIFGACWRLPGRQGHRRAHTLARKRLVSWKRFLGRPCSGYLLPLLLYLFADKVNLINGTLSLAISIPIILFCFVCAHVAQSLRRSLDSLKYISLVALGGTLFAGFVVVFQYVEDPSHSRAPGVGDSVGTASIVLANYSERLWEAIPVINVVFTAHYNSPRCLMMFVHA
jgi:amino acid permease